MWAEVGWRMQHARDSADMMLVHDGAAGAAGVQLSLDGPGSIARSLLLLWPLGAWADVGLSYRLSASVLSPS